jgi:arylsulfatase A-like enzyme
MRLIYFDVDTLRADHLGCYGYNRPTSPVIDGLAARGLRLDNVHASDTPCLPSRSALSTGQFGIRNGAVNHGGIGTDLLPEGARRGFRTEAAAHSWMAPLRDLGMWTTSISTFAERHSAYHFDAGFNECLNLGTRGIETADQVAAVARDWLLRNGHRDDWFLHVHLWDPHTPYRTPSSFGDPFDDEPVPTWLDEEVRAAHWLLPGPHSAQELAGFGPRDVWDRYPRQPHQAASMDDVRRIFDGYDTGIRYADDQIGQLLDVVDVLGLTDDTAVMVTADHGENLGELGIYCDHQTADQHTTRLPFVLAWPGLHGPGRDGVGRDGVGRDGVGSEVGTPAGLGPDAVDTGLHYQIDVMATVLELAGAEVPERWDGSSFADALRSGRPTGRDHLVLSHGAWTAQRAVRFGEWICIRTYHDAFHGFPEVLLFDLETDPHEQQDVAADHPDVVEHALARLAEWASDALAHSPTGVDPLWTVMTGGGPWHSRVDVPWYLDRLRATGRGRWADHFAAQGWPRPPGPALGVLGP